MKGFNKKRAILVSESVNDIGMENTMREYDLTYSTVERYIRFAREKVYRNGEPRILVMDI